MWILFALLLAAKKKKYIALYILYIWNTCANIIIYNDIQVSLFIIVIIQSLPCRPSILSSAFIFYHTDIITI